MNFATMAAPASNSHQWHIWSQFNFLITLLTSTPSNCNTRIAVTCGRPILSLPYPGGVILPNIFFARASRQFQFFRWASCQITGQKVQSHHGPRKKDSKSQTYAKGEAAVQPPMTKFLFHGGNPYPLILKKSPAQLHTSRNQEYLER